MGKALLEESLVGRARRREQSIKLQKRKQRIHFPRGEIKIIHTSQCQSTASSDAPYGSKEGGICEVYDFVVDMDLFSIKRDCGDGNVEEETLPSERTFHSEGGNMSNRHRHISPLIASEAYIARRVEHQSYVAAVVPDNASKNLDFDAFNSDLI